MVSQWLKLAFGVKRALGILVAFKKMEAQSLIWNPKGPIYLPFICLARPDTLCACVIAHTVTQVLYTSLFLDNRSAVGVMCITRWFSDVSRISTARL